MNNLAISNKLNFKKQNIEVEQNIPFDENLALKYKEEVIKELKQQLGDNLHTETILEEIVKRTTGLKKAKNTVMLVNILANILNNIYNNPSAREITKNELQEITVLYQEKIPKYTINVDSKGALMIKTPKINYRMSNAFPITIFLFGALKNEKELINTVNENIDPYIRRFENACGDAKIDDLIKDEVKREEMTLTAEELLRNINSLKKSEDKKNGLEFGKIRNHYYVDNGKARIFFDEKSEETLEKLQNCMLKSKTLESIMRIADKSTKDKMPEKFKLLNESLLLYKELRDLGITMDITKNKKDQEVVFEFPFGAKKYEDIRFFKNASSKWSLPYTEKMIKDYELAYNKHFDAEKFFNYLYKSADTDINYKNREREVKKIKRNLKIARNNYKELEKSNKFKMKPKIIVPNIAYVANNTTLKDSERIKQRVIDFNIKTKMSEKQRKKKVLKNNIKDAIFDYLVIPEGVVDEILEREENRRAESVKEMRSENNRYKRLQNTYKEAFEIIDKKKETLASSSNKRLTSRKNILKSIMTTKER